MIMKVEIHVMMYTAGEFNTHTLWYCTDRRIGFMELRMLSVSKWLQ